MRLSKLSAALLVLLIPACGENSPATTPVPEQEPVAAKEVKLPTTTGKISDSPNVVLSAEWLNIGNGPYGFRSGGGRRRAALKFGGARKSESAVDAGLHWLVENQEEDGSWAAINEDARVSVTGLALLAFLTAGHTELYGKYPENVKNAVSFLISKQNKNGCIGDSSRFSNHIIAGCALAEALGMQEIKRTRAAAQKAMDYSVKNFSGDHNLSVTAWYALQLKVAKIALLKVPESGMQGVTKVMDLVASEEKTPTSTALTMFIRMTMGHKRTEKILIDDAKYLMRHPLEWGKNDDMFAYWHFSNLVMFQMGGKYWKSWNEKLRDELIINQVNAEGSPLDGSWEPINDAKKMGRVYSTAISVLCLEIYYRYKRVE